MEFLSTLFVAALILIAAAVLMIWHFRAWRDAQQSKLAPGELVFYRRQFRRRLQTSAVLGLLALVILAGEILIPWLQSPVFFTIFLVAVILLVTWLMLLSVMDIWATRYHFGKLREKCLLEQTKLQAEMRLVQDRRKNGKPSRKKDILK